MFLTGGILYSAIEILWRGYTHWSMTLAGGICLALIHWLNMKLHGKDILLKCLLGGLLITAVEFTAGVIVNLWLGLNVWDYSGMTGNLLGQICPAFSVLWFLISFPACMVSDGTRKVFAFLEKREYPLTA